MSAAGGDVEINSPGRGDRADHQERRQHVPQPEQRRATARVVRLRQRRRRDRGARLHRQPEPLLRRSAPRHRRSDHARQAVVLHLLQLLQDRQDRLRHPAGDRHRPRHLPRGAGQADLQAVAGRHPDRALPVGLQVQAAARTVGDHADGIGARAGQPLLDRQGSVAARVVEPPVHRRALRVPRLRLADDAQRQCVRQPAAHRRRHQHQQRRRLGCVRQQAVPAAGAADLDLLPADTHGQPRPQVRRQLRGRHRANRDQRQLGADPLPRSSPA